MLLQPLTSLAHLLLAEWTLPMPVHPRCAAAGRAGAGTVLGWPNPVAGHCRYPKNTHVQPTHCPQASIWPHYGQAAQKAAVLDRVGPMLCGFGAVGAEVGAGLELAMAPQSRSITGSVPGVCGVWVFCSLRKKMFCFALLFPS